MHGRFRSDILPIGIEVGNDAVKMLQLRRVHGDAFGSAPRYAVIAAARRRFSESARAHPETRLAEAPVLIRQLRQAAAFVGRRVVAAMPSPWLVFRTLRVAEGQPLNRSSIFERLQPQLSAPPSECRLGIMLCGPVRQGNESAEEVLAFAAPGQAIDEFLEALHLGGLWPDALDVEHCAAWRAFARAAGVTPGEQLIDRALLEIGELRSVLLIGQGGLLRFAKPIDVGSRHLDEAICRRLGISADDARELRMRSGGTSVLTNAVGSDTVQAALSDATRGLLEKLSGSIAQCLRYYAVAFRGSPVRGFYLSGAGNVDPHLVAAMQSAPLPLRTWEPFREIDVSAIRLADRRVTTAQWTVALGLSLRGEPSARAFDAGISAEPEVAHA